MATDHGGHLGFISKATPHFWLDRAVLSWMEKIRNEMRRESVLLK
jgi:predicted alpha/beta-fold hydrolase